MNTTVDISWGLLASFSGLLLIPYWLSKKLHLELERDGLISVGRMALQLILVGLYLGYLFHLNSLLVNLLWLAVMVVVGASAILNKSKLPKQPLLLAVMAGLLSGLVPLLFIITVGLIQPSPVYHAQYMIPLAGMLLGNSLSGCIVALQNFFTSLTERQTEYQAAISLGAAPSYACRPFVQAAIGKSMAPTLASMSTMGLVTLPGMMTGQILGGASPMVAIKYQMMIMIAILVMLSISVTVTLRLTVKMSFDRFGKVLITPIKSE